MMKTCAQFFGMLLLVAALSGCNDITSEPSSDTKARSFPATLTLTSLDSSNLAASRAAKPTELATGNEGKLYDAIIVIYDQTLTGSLNTNALDNKKVIEAVNVSLTETASGSNKYRTQKFPLELPVGTYYFTVIANPHSSISATTFRNMGLKDFRDYVYAPDPCSVASTIKACDRFVMTSDQERSFVVTNSNFQLRQELDITGGTAVTVERLAARVDLSFGVPAAAIGSGAVYRDASNNILTFSGATPSATVASIVLPVYDYDIYTTQKTLVPTGDTYTITGVQMLNVVKNQEYLIQRTSNGCFTDEVWNASTGYAKKTVSNPKPLAKENPLQLTLGSLISDGNNMYTNGNSRFYTLGYFRENTDVENISDIEQGKTAIKIQGTYHRTGDLEHAASTGAHDIVFTIRHCLPVEEFNPGNTMAYSLLRNTIYRVSIDKVFSDAEKVYVRWYYDAYNDGEYDLYTSGTPFFSVIQENGGNTSTPTD